MADALVDFASLDSAAAATETTTPTVDTETPAVDSTTTEVDTPAVDSGVESETHNADGSEKTPEETEAFKTAAAAKAESDKSIDTKTTPDHVRKALKVMRDTDPKNAGVVKELHGSFERWNAAKAISVSYTHLDVYKRQGKGRKLSEHTKELCRKNHNPLSNRRAT